jgi:hypothetical protein
MKAGMQLARAASQPACSNSVGHGEIHATVLHKKRSVQVRIHNHVLSGSSKRLFCCCSGALRSIAVTTRSATYGPTD